MPRIIKTHSGPATGQKVFLATPAYGDVSAGFASALFETGKCLKVPSELFLLTGNCHVDDSRNEIVRCFLESDCTDLFFIDADLRWSAEDVDKLLAYDCDVVGGTYPLKQKETAFPVLNGEKDCDLYEVDGLPTGFLRIRRNVLEALAQRAQKFYGKKDSKDRRPIPLIFERTILDGKRLGGDYTFCKKWRDIGGTIFLDPDLDFNHFGEEVWSGNYKRFLRRQNGLGEADALQAIAEGREEAEDFVELYHAWGSEWSATPELLKACLIFARQTNGHILECGSGLTTLAMAKANPRATIHALEHDPLWAKKLRDAIKRHGITNVVLHNKPLKEYGDYLWYDAGGLPEVHFDLVLCDGPPRVLASRKGLFDNCSGHINGGMVLMDDVEDPSQLAHLSDWAKEQGRKIQFMGEERVFALCYKER